MITEKQHSHFPQASPPERGPPMSDMESDAEVDRRPYQGWRPGTEPKFGRGIMVGIATILVLIVGVGGLIAIFLW